MKKKKRGIQSVPPGAAKSALRAMKRGGKYRAPGSRPSAALARRIAL